MSDDGSWLDMSRFPDVDPDAAVSSDDQMVIQDALSVDPAEVPDEQWDGMVSVASGAEQSAPVDAGTTDEAWATDEAADPEGWSSFDDSGADHGDAGHDHDLLVDHTHDSGFW